MLTAGEALARDRPVLAVPGHPTSPASAGTLDLIADGAVPVRDVTDVLVAIGLGGRKTAEALSEPDPHPEVSDTATRLLAELDPNPRTLGELMLVGPWGLDQASLALIELEQAGLVIRSGAWFERSGVGGARTRTVRDR
ncbi:MAG: DprA [Ilumatobacteraceae bacterium]|nr:DprA [Ilumatobacteraceae bacterium]